MEIAEIARDRRHRRDRKSRIFTAEARKKDWVGDVGGQGVRPGASGHDIDVEGWHLHAGKK